jgi:glycosyltransferase involved in cell wall biosynthesis
MKRFGLHEEEFIILSVAALLWEKGVHEILHAFKQLTLDHPNRRLRLVYAGSGGEKEPLQDLARRIGLQEHVSFLRFSYEEIHYAYNMADIFVLASAPRKGWLEQFGYVLAEALASGAPIITTLSGSIPEVVGGAAMLVPPSDFLALRDAMNDLILNPEKSEELSQKGRAWAERHYDNQKNALEIRKAYEELF